MTNDHLLKRFLYQTNSISIWFFLAKIILLVSVIYALNNLAFALQIVPELTDAAYYVLQTRFADQFYIQLHPYGIYWVSFFGENSVYVNRLISLFLIIFAPIFFMMRLSNAKGFYDELKLFRLLIAGVIFLSVFGMGIVDPSYNAMVAVCACIAFAVAVKPINKLSVSHDLMIRSFLLGVIAPVLLLTKISSTPIIGSLVIVYFLASLPDLRLRLIYNLGLITFCGMLGAAVALGLLYLKGFGNPVVLFLQIYDSISAFSLLRSHEITLLSISIKFTNYFSDIIELFDRGFWSNSVLIVLPILVSVKSILCRYPFFIKSRWVYALLAILAILLGGYTAFYIDLELFKDFEALSQDFSVLVILITLALALQNIVFYKSFSIARFLPLAFTPLFLVIGTNNAYIYFLPFYVGFFVIISLNFINVSWITNQQYKLSTNGAIHHGLVVALTISVAVILASNIAVLTHKPYRFFSSLEKNLKIVEFGVPAEQLLASPSLAESYQAVMHLKQAKPINEESQTIIDWTGRSPGIVLHLGLRPVETSWLVGSYSGEGPFAQEVLRFAKDQDIANAWIIVSNKMTRSPALLRALLREHGRIFPDDYEVIGVFPNPNQRSKNYIVRVKQHSP